MIEGASGVLAKAHPDYRPRYEPSKRRLSWSNGSVATLLGADEPERFRGGNYHWAVCDELRAWRRPESFDLLQFAVRLPYNEIPPQVTIATTPIGSPLLKRLLSDKGVVITRGSTYDNRGNLAQGFFEQIIKRYEGTRLGKQELDGVLLGDIQGALWTWEMLEKAREGQGWTGEGRIVVAVDPAISSGSDSDETGIIVVGKGRSDRRYYVLEDASLKASPDNWARAAINAYNRWRATNRPDVLDPALVRPGRFDRRVTLDLPDIKDREEILGIHAKNKPLAEGVSLRKIAERTPGFSGADLANLLNEAAILAVRRGMKRVSETDILESIEKVLLGPERKNRIISDHEKKMTAYHEAGHAIVGHYLPHGDPVRKVSIISRGSAGGYTLKMPTEDKHYHTLAQFKDELAMMMGGYVVEKLIFGDEMLSTGPSSDLSNATKVAHDMVVRYGMSAMGPRTFGDHQEMVFLGREITEQRDYSEKTAEAIDKEVSSLLAEAEKRAKEVVEKRKDKLEEMVAELMVKETLEQEDVDRIFGARQ
jgi:hypothetical protein